MLEYIINVAVMSLILTSWIWIGWLPASWFSRAPERPSSQDQSS